MHPTLINLGPLVLSSFGFFLVLAFLSAVFIIWRIARVYEINEEKILDLILLTFFSGLIGSRLYFALTHWQQFGNLSSLFLISRYPGLSLWGGLILGSIALWLLSRRSKLNFWQATDFGVVGLILALSIGDIGCLLGGCNYGLPSSSPVAIPILGVIGNRFPLAGLESVIFFLVFLNLWSQEVKFHFTGKVTAFFLLIFGFLKFCLEFFRGDSEVFPIVGWISQGQVFGLLAVIFGIVVFYYRSKRDLLFDLKSITTLPFSSKKRQKLMLTLRKTWYNQLVDFKFKIFRLPKAFKQQTNNLRKKLNVQSTPTDLNKN